MAAWTELKKSNRFPGSFDGLNLNHADVSGIVWHHFQQVLILISYDWQKLMLAANLEIMTT